MAKSVSLRALSSVKKELARKKKLKQREQDDRVAMVAAKKEKTLKARRAKFKREREKIRQSRKVRK